MVAKTVDTGDKVVGGGKYMRAIVSIDNGNVTTKTHVFTHVKLAGFTGGMLASFSDLKGEVLYVTPFVSYGVDGELIPFKDSDRWVDAHYSVDPSIGDRTDRIDVWVGLAPHNRLGDILASVKDILTLVQKIADLGSQPPDPSPDGHPVLSDPPILTTAHNLLGYTPQPNLPVGQVIQIVSHSSGKVLDVPGFAPDDGVLIQQFTANGGANQQWQLVPADGGFFKIVSHSSGKVLDVPGFAPDDGVLIQQFTANGGTNQQWQLVPVDGDFFKIVSHSSGKVLDVPGFAPDDGVLIQQFTANGGTNQQWRLVPVN